MSKERERKQRNMEVVAKHFYVQSSRIKYPLYHLSFSGKLEGDWIPQKPHDDYEDELLNMTEDQYLLAEPIYPRISASPTVEQCYQAIYMKVRDYFIKKNYPHMDFFVYSPDFLGKERVVLPKRLTDYNLVHDAHITEEHMILDKTVMVLKQKIRIPNNHKGNEVVYHPFNEKHLGKSFLPTTDLNVETLEIYS